jgi:hypothetical protein
MQQSGANLHLQGMRTHQIGSEGVGGLLGKGTFRYAASCPASASHDGGASISNYTASVRYALRLPAWRTARSCTPRTRGALFKNAVA